MIYFKKIYFTDLDKEQMELAFRKMASKSSSSVNLSGNTNVGTNKHWVGLEGKVELKFTRIRYFIEGYLPKMIICIPKNENTDHLKIKLGLLTSIIFCFLTLGTLMNIVFLFINIQNIDNFIDVFIIYFIFIFLILIEYKLTSKRISKTILEFNNNN